MNNSLFDVPAKVTYIVLADKDNVILVCHVCNALQEAERELDRIVNVDRKYIDSWTEEPYA